MDALGLAAVVAGVLGLAVGSFLNVVIYRVPRNMSVVSPPSHCPACGKPVRPWDNVPVVGFFLLRGKPEHSKAPPPTSADRRLILHRRYSFVARNQCEL